MVWAPSNKIVQWVRKILRIAWGHKSLANQIKCAIFYCTNRVIKKGLSHLINLDLMIGTLDVNL